MNVLFVSDAYPAFDRSSYELRLYRMLVLLAEAHSVTHCSLDLPAMINQLGSQAVSRYAEALTLKGVLLANDGLELALRNSRFDVVVFVIYTSASKAWIRRVRYWLPTAKIVVDSVDVQFGRFESRARLTGSSSDLAYAESIKRLELAAYSQADLVIVVSEPERQLLVKHMPFDRIDLISNIHPLPDIVPSSQRDGKSLVFIGWGAYAPNVDAVLYFAQQVLPLILLEVPQARFLVIGRDYPPEVQSLTGPSIDLLGYVSDVSEILGTADVSVAPLRFGSGLKGKIGEALSFGIPVVSTRIGTEGFGLLPGEQVLVGDSPEAFARHVVSLLRDRSLHQKIGNAGRSFIEERYSETSARRQLSEVFDKVSRIRYPLSRTAWRVWRSRIRHFWIRYVSWRIGRYF